MPRRLRQQKRGKGSPTFRAPSFKYTNRVSYRELDENESEDNLEGKVIDIINDPARTSPLMVLEFENGEVIDLPAPQGIEVDEKVSAGKGSEVKQGNILPLGEIPAGTDIYNIELTPGDGGKIGRASGAKGKVVAHEDSEVIVRLPSKNFKTLNPRCRATVGKVAGGGREEKPVMKAGKKHHMTKARGKYWPITAGVAMNAVDHPFGGTRRASLKKLKTRSKHSSPGQKVGSISARRTGKKER